MSDIKEFIDMAARYPLLTQQQEIELGRRIQRWLQAEKPSQAAIRSGLRARDQFVCCNLRLVIAIAKKYRARIKNTNLAFADLLQEGVIGLQRAAEKYDPECGYKMSTYAYWWIRQAITRAIDMKSSMIHVPSGAKQKLNKFRESAAQGGSIDSILERADLKEKDLITIEQANMCYLVHHFDAQDLNML
jgi:RNA polymerase sigma factor (sigma-70 family)